MGRALQVSGWIVVALVVAAGRATHAAPGETATVQHVAVKEPPYDPAGKRDPFQPQATEQGPPTATGQRTPLQQFELSQLRLVAIIRDDADPAAARAVVEDGGGLGYIMRVGTSVGRNEGRVTAIEESQIVIEEWPVNVFGERRRSVVVKELDAGEEAKR
jgi:Tfp pilus assembly protein PilP